MKKNIEVIIKLASTILILCACLSYWYAPFHWVFLLGLFLLQLLLFYNAEALSHQKKGSPKWKTYRFLVYGSTCFCITFFLIVNLKDETSAMNLTSSMLCVFMIVFGNYAPKIPYNRTLGLRLPWTLHSEATWKYAHRMLGWCSFPCAFFYGIGSYFTIHECSVIALCVWILFPAYTSYQYEKRRKNHELHL